MHEGSVKDMQGNTEILIVEDSPTQAEKLRSLLAGKGYRPQVVANGRLALEALRKARPSLVLSDVVMPEMDGYTLCREIKASPGTRDVPVILVTSLIDPRDIVRGLECGADSFVRKPYDDGYLLTRIEHVLMNQQLRQSESGDGGLALYVDGVRHVVNAERRQILDLLISTYEQAVIVNEELLRREKQVNELNARLAQHAAQLEATNREVERKNLELQQASRMKSEFLANMSHELRTPLNAIIGFSEALKHGLLGNLEPQQEEYVGDIFDSGKHLLSLINDILDLSKIEAGKMEVEAELTDIKQLLQSSLTVFREKAMTGRIHLRLEMETIGWVMLDQRKTRQVLYNLVSNAVKFTREGGSVTLRVCMADQPLLDGRFLIGEDDESSVEHRTGRYLEMSVIDTGIGIAPHDLQRLCRPFEQLDSGLARRYEGTGLGLALVKQLVELQGGFMAVRSRLGQGSEFTVWLPYRELSE
jgi:signal transduction histidine kinase